MKGKEVRRIVTGHDENGRAIFKSDNVYTPELIPSGDAAMVTLWTAATVPVNNNDETDGRDRDAGLTLNGGSVIRTCDMLPGAESSMHRTNSLDCGIVISGKIELELDDGVKKLCSAGDVIVQRGTIHLWRNPSLTEICRLVFILTEATAYQHDGKPLDELEP